ncbi:coatomer zeta subunit [Perkinsela sp. CCAP 1560/4]|nr:coatomer zeta subunit [Perkinsela sp. CCAP 1560/4]KNH06711.1 coatomer zeta subunit [Perkinsela sp. CCAP 1560/4]|eukprot:KNH04706.1 coatomer zeta subunit [Perkinsela sp. CCAP 1560/4]
MEFLPKVQTILAFDRSKTVRFVRSFLACRRYMRLPAEDHPATALEILQQEDPTFFQESIPRSGQALVRFCTTEDALFYLKEIEDIVLCIVADRKENAIYLSKLVKCIEQSMTDLISNRCPLHAETFRIDLDTFTFVIDAMIDDGVVISINPEKVVTEVKPFVLTKLPNR